MATPRIAQTGSKAHGLLLQPALVLGRDAEAIAALGRLIVPCRYAQKPGAKPSTDAIAVEAGLRPEYLQVESVERFSLEPTVEDLARTADKATATFALRRLEYRSSSVRLLGGTFPTDAILVALMLSLAGGLLAVGIATGGKRFAAKRRAARMTPPLQGPMRTILPTDGISSTIANRM